MCIVVLSVVLVGYTATFSALFAGPCNPNLNTPESAICLNNIAVAQAVLNIVTDGFIIALPIPTIHGLNMGLKQRLTVGFILALGSAYVIPPRPPHPPSCQDLPNVIFCHNSSACIASIIRIAYVRAMVTNPDITYTQCAAAVWSLLEMNLGILCNSLAALKPFIREFLPGLLSSYGRSGGNGDYKSSGQTGPSKRSKGSKAWGHGYQLHSVGNGKTEQTATKDNVVVVGHEFSVEYNTGQPNAAITTNSGGSTDSILSPQYPAQKQPL